MRLQRVILITILGLLPHMANAQLTLSAGIEYLNWEEDVTPSVKEDGPVFALGVGYTQKRDEGLVFSYRGRLWLGSVDYTGATLLTRQPITGTTGYTGLTNEAQARWRRPMQNDDYRMDFVGGIGIDAWRRELSSVQREDWFVTYIRAGFEVDSEFEQTWMYGIGIKYPIWVSEDAHLDSIGFDSNPELKPGGKVSLYTHIGYRLRDEWAVIGYIDGFRFSRSDDVTATEIANGIGPLTIYQPASDMLFFGIRLERRFP